MQNPEYDYVIVGGGSGGNVVVTRLVEAGNRVLLLEGGKRDSHLYVKAPAGMFMLNDTGHAIAHETVPQPSANGRPMYIPVGATLGGGSSVNGMVYIRGQREDYDEWRDAGNPGWAWDDVLPYFKKAENNQRLAGEEHGTDGPLPVSDPTHKHALSRAFVLAAQQAGYPFNHDFNAQTGQGNRHGQMGAGYYQTTTIRGTRASTTATYLGRVKGNRNLTIQVNSPVSRLLLEGRKAVGVRVAWDGGPERDIRAAKGVVLAAGALVTPKILMLSGIGPAAHLQSHGIDVALDLPGVGGNLQDHLEVHVQARTKEPISLFGENRGWRRIRHGMEWVFFRQGVLTSNIVEAGGFFDLDGDGRPDVQIHMVPTFNSDVDRAAPDGHGFSLDPCYLRPKSRGEVRLRSADPNERPLVDPHFLEAQDDVDTLVRGVHLSRAILAQPALADLLTEEVMPGRSVQSDADIEAFVRGNAKTAYHPVGTCKMGSDDMAVVDSRLRLRGIENAWISDASIMPLLVSGNTNAPTIMIGERAADFVLGRG